MTAGRLWTINLSTGLPSTKTRQPTAYDSTQQFGRGSSWTVQCGPRFVSISPTGSSRVTADRSSIQCRPPALWTHGCCRDQATAFGSVKWIPMYSARNTNLAISEEGNSAPSSWNSSQVLVSQAPQFPFPTPYSVSGLGKELLLTGIALKQRPRTSRSCFLFSPVWGRQTTQLLRLTQASRP